MTTSSDYETKKARLVEAFRAQQTGKVALAKKSSNLFRPRRQGHVQRLDVRSLDDVISVDTDTMTAEIEGMATYETIVDELLKFGVMPAVVPQLKTITIGGGVSGLAIESSSFHEGLTHESVIAMEVLLASGDVVTATATNSYKDLFHALPNSYGTLGYILKVTIEVRPVKPFVHLLYISFTDVNAFFTAMQKVCHSGRYQRTKIQFVDGVIFSRHEMYLVLATEVDEAPYVSDYTYKKMFYRSLQQRTDDYLTIHDYLWRWDTDWFWCSKNVGAQNPLLRRLLGRKRLGSRTYSRMMAFENRYHIVTTLGRLFGQSAREIIIQDVQLPINHAGEFLDFFHEKIGIAPIWTCPTRAADSKKWSWTLYPMDPGTLYVNIGFWDSAPAITNKPNGYLNRLIEKKVSALRGTKGLYSSSYYPRAEFEKLYNYSAYSRLKSKYDPGQRFKDLYDKCVRGA